MRPSVPSSPHSPALNQPRPKIPVLSSFVLLAMMTCGCQSYLFERQCPEAVAETRTTVAIARAAPVDILFVIDNSGSMADEQQNLVNNFDAFVNIITQNNLDYRIAVVSTDLTSAQPQGTQFELGGLQSFEIDVNSPLRTVDNNNRENCMTIVGTEHGCFRSSRAERWIDSANDSPDAVRSVFASTALVGTCGSGSERGTTAMVVALENTMAGRCNNGFLREEANLVVIVVTDEDDDRPQTPNTILSRLSSVKPIERIRFALIGAIVDGSPSTCRTAQDGTAVAMCGSLCDMPAPAQVSAGPCAPDGSCPTFFECDDGECLDLASRRWNAPGSGGGCDSCSSYNVDSCCSADIGGDAYHQFALAFEEEVNRRDPSVEVTQCRGGGTNQPACLLGSICEAQFANQLEQIARDLVVSRTITIDPPASNPSGVFVQFEGGVDGPRPLVNGVDFTVSNDGRQLTLGVDPETNETLEVFVSEIVRPDDGACGDL